MWNRRQRQAIHATLDEIPVTYVLVNKWWIRVLNILVIIGVSGVLVLAYLEEKRQVRSVLSQQERRAYGLLTQKRAEAFECLWLSNAQMRLKAGLQPMTKPNIYLDEAYPTTDEAGETIMVEPVPAKCSQETGGR